jgi:THO complex subunit 4
LEVRYKKSRSRHYILTVIQDLFNRIGPVLRLSLTYDRAGRSDGIAYVTYESAQDAKRAIREFDGANAKGMMITTISLQWSNSFQVNQFV